MARNSVASAIVASAVVTSVLAWRRASSHSRRVRRPRAPQPLNPPRGWPTAHPDLSGVWWTGGDVGGRGYGGGRGRGGRAGGPPPATYASLLTPAAAAAAKKMADKDDPTLKCIPTAFGTLNVSMFDVGAVAQIVATPKFVVMLTETFHGYRIVPTDGRKHREEVPPSYRGDSVGHWEGDVFVVDTKNFTDDTWISAEGRVSPHSDQLRIVERYRRVDKNTLEIEATLTIRRC